MSVRRVVLIAVASALLVTGSALADDPRDQQPDPGVVSNGHLDEQLKPQPQQLVEPQQGTWELVSDPGGGSAFSPEPRLLHSAVLDPVSRRMLVFGGLQFETAFDQVLALPLGSSAGWSELSTAGTSPGPRRDHTAVYDPIRRRMLVFGGSRAANSFLNDLWALSLDGLPTWSEVTTGPTQPPGRFAHTAAYDPVRDRMIVFGGYNGSFLGDVWALSLATIQWTRLLPAGSPPTNRNAMTAIYDPDGDRLVIFGGWDGSQYRSDVWALSLAGTPTWSLIPASGNIPSGRRHHAAVYDDTRHRLVIQGGLGASGYRSDAFELPLVGAPIWSAMAVTGAVPDPRNGHRAIYDPTGDRLVMFGGYGNAGYLGDTHALDFAHGNRWSVFPETEVAPSERRDQIAVYDAPRDRLLMFGGWDRNFLSDTWALSLSGTPAWGRIAPSGETPPARFAHAGIHDAARDRLVVFGGYDGTFRNDVWALSLSGQPTWTRLSVTGEAPVGRDAMTAFYDAPRHRMLVFGGWSGFEYLNDLWSLELEGAPVWTRLTTPSGLVPSPRRHYAALLDEQRQRLVVHGGFDDSFLDDTWELQLSGPQSNRWSRIQTSPRAAGPSARNAHRAVYDPVRDQMWFFGGYDGEYRQDAWALPFADHPTRWTPVVALGMTPEARLLHSAVYDPVRDRVLVFGGEFHSRRFNDTWAFRWNPEEATAPGDGFEGRQASPMAVPRAAAPPAFALEAVAPNPIVGEMTVRFTLENDHPASLELFSVAGQQVFRRDLGGLSAGTHAVRLGDDMRLAPGVYVLRLSALGRSASRTIAVVP